MNEQKVSTSHKKIMILKDSKSHIPWNIFKTSIQQLTEAAIALDSEKIQILLKQILPTYTPRVFTTTLNDKDDATSQSSIKAELRFI